ncbi:choline/ethanolamine phosphotransferase 1 [Phyllostomus discolor]|uniref:Choline/ethanolamine phosphotransferase 1 n=1 Tax=Phyllostomus discolor TaxID=89673 RepID=A0A833YJJ2_9CHIR|nr:choline/ethanolamine phosphotransferase 1 [Phyllostomus discolor]
MIYKKSAVQLFEKHPCLYILTFGFVSAKITNKLVVAHMTKSEMHLHDTAFIGPALLFLDQYFNSFIDEYIVLWIALVGIALHDVQATYYLCWARATIDLRIVTIGSVRTTFCGTFVGVPCGFVFEPFFALLLILPV